MVEFCISNLGPLDGISISAGSVGSFVRDLLMNTDNVRLLFHNMQTFPAISLITASKKF